VITAEFNIKNVGPADGAEVAQLYVQPIKPRLPRPVKELKGFNKVFLKAGEQKTVSIPLNRNSFSFYDPAQHSWVAEKDEYKILIGASSRDVRLNGSVRLADTTLEK